MEYHYVFTLALLGAIIMGLIALLFITWLWGKFLDNFEHDPAKVQTAMYLVLLMSSATEAGFAFCELMYNWPICVGFIANVWGRLDALLRFPAGHDMGSFFSLKQFFLQILKMLCFAFGFRSFRRDCCIVVLILLLDNIALPVMYLMALPLDPAEQVLKDDSYDVDLIVRVYWLLIHPHERLQLYTSCRACLHRKHKQYSAAVGTRAV